LSNVENVDTTKASNVNIDGTLLPTNSAILTNDSVKVAFQKAQGQIDNLSNAKQNNVSVSDTDTIDLTFSNSNLQANVINASIDESKLANNAVTRDKILNNSVSNEKIATGVSTEKLQQTTFADNPNALVNGEALDVSLNKIQYQAKDAIHKNTSNEINNLTNKATLIDSDVVIGENSANLFSKIKFSMASVASFILSKDKNVKNLYISGGVNGTGLDTNNGYSPNNALNTLATLLTKLGNTGESVIFLPNPITESGNFSQLNIDVKGDNAAMGAMCGTTGTITSSNASSSQRYTNLSFGNFTKSGAGGTYLKSLAVGGNLIDTSAGYFDINGANLNNISITGTGIKSFVDISTNGTITINNAQVSVSIQANERGITLSSTNAITLTAGTLSIKNAIIFCPANTVFGTSGFNLLLDNVKFIDPATGLSQTINIPTGVKYSLQNCEYASNSTINGIDISSTRIKRSANVFAKVAEIVTATIQTLNVKDKTILLNSSNSTDASADGGGLIVKGAANKSILFTNASGSNPSNFSSSENVNVASDKNFYINNTLYSETTKTLKNTTINVSDFNTISGITNDNIAANADINVNKLGDGTVTNEKFFYISNLVSDAQTQLNGKQDSSDTLDKLSYVNVLSSDAYKVLQATNDDGFELSLPIKNLTTNERNALASVPSGYIIYNSTDDKFQTYNSSAWANIVSAGTGNVSTTGVTGATNKLVFSTNDNATSLGRPLLSVAERQSALSDLKALGSYTSTERDTLTWTNGDTIFNKTTYAVESYINGSWVQNYRDTTDFISWHANGVSGGGTLLGNATWRTDGNSGLRDSVVLTTNGNNQKGHWYKNIPQMAHKRIILKSDYCIGGGNGADGMYYSLFANSAPTTSNTNTTQNNSYTIYLDIYNSFVTLYYNGAILQQKKFFGGSYGGTDHIKYLEFIVNYDQITQLAQISCRIIGTYGGTGLCIDYQDTVVRNLSGSFLIVGAFTGALNNFHIIKSLSLQKYYEQ